MKIVCVSDLHGYLPDISPADVLVIAGDICPTCDHSITFQKRWLADNFYPWMQKLHRSGTVKKIIYIAGNHDFAFEEIGQSLANPTGDYTMSTEWDRISYLQDSSVIVNLEELGTGRHEPSKTGIKFYGLPWQRRFYDWAFNLDEPELAEKYSKIPDDTDVIISHGPAQFYGDAVYPRKWHDEEKYPEIEHVGSPSLLKRIDEIQPKLLVTGHIHSGYGMLYRRHGSQARNEDTIMINASYVDESYKPKNKMWEIEL